MSLIRKHVAVLQAWACLDLVTYAGGFEFQNPEPEYTAAKTELNVKMANDIKLRANL